MRIAIAGASGTGKTFLAEAIAQKYGLPVNPVGARSVALGMGFSNPYDVDRAGRRREFQERLFVEKRAWEAEHDGFVTDRSYFDNLAYCALHMPTELPDDAVAEYAQAMQRYTEVLLCPRHVFQKLDDGVRQTSAAYHELYELMVLGLLGRHYRYAAHSAKFLFLDVPLDERTAWAFSLLDLPK